MKRLTERKGNGVINVRYATEHETAIHRLASIEDILGDEYKLDRLRELVEAEKEDRYIIMKEPRRAGVHRLTELAEADREGRCVVLPCKGWFDLVFGEQEVFYGIDTDYPENPIREITVRNEERFTWYDGWESVIFNGTYENGLDHEFTPEEIGKTVFLTREEAEAKLKERENNG